ncbi:centromere-associated protein E [Sorex araneus]|uniref:centromere-associated protein E n=1 Tax=Sorex araneus TaxID=42254 RepID=UPI002433DE9D|nr:centromere-associated protein E [Sorex araneus]
MAEASAVAVCVRVRPLNSREEALGEETQVYWKTGNNAIYQVDGSKSFSFDRVFGSEESTKNVYEEIAVPIIDSAIQGYNGTIFAYGQTASGKTYTMMGSKDHLGVIPRAIHDIFQKIQKFPDREFLLRVSYMEIYNETITDLLCDTQKVKPLIIREDYNRNVYVSDLTEEVVYTSDMALKWITKGEKNRHYGITKMNQRSSRSHTIFRMILESREKDASSCEGAVKVSHLNLVDLAGSERAAQTGAEGLRLKEGCNINRSLFILGQVIKKLSDEQAGGFINYRDSKLTRILQNSLGGNAKTRIICTITPVSFDETLSTLQFASTAKHMKNTPYVNEVSSDEALLKRYRKEIMDLKKQLEEVSLETRAQAMEKDQLAQLLEEKDLLQKVQIEKIQNLTRMLVTSSSLTSQQELKAKKKRRVTWCVGKINKVEKAKFGDGFSLPASVTTKTNRSALGSVGEMDESLYSDADPLSSTLDTLAEIEWNPATKLLASDNWESELGSLRAEYDNLVLDYEQLRRENKELETKLKEKNDLEEFEALERKAGKDQEMQLIHEISNLKNLVKHSEAYNQDLENELREKAEQLREKEDQIQQLQESLDRQKPQSPAPDLSYSAEPAADTQQLRQSLLDAEAVALDARRESAFLRGENRELCERLRELEGRCGQLESDLQGSRRQLEARRKVQADLEKELQSSFSEIARLTAALGGQGPGDALPAEDLERKIRALQAELQGAAGEKEALLAALGTLPSEVETLRKEVLEKSEELSLLAAEKDRLLSELAGREGSARGAEDEPRAPPEDQAVVGEQLAALRLSLATLEAELSQKTQELRQREAESQQQRDAHEARLRAAEQDRVRVAEQLEQALVDVRALTQEKDALREAQASLQAECGQLQCDIRDTVNMNIDTQEQLRDAQEALRQKEEAISSLRRRLAAQGAQEDCPEQGPGGDGQPAEAEESQRKIVSLAREREELQQELEHARAEREQLRRDLQESIETAVENQEELRRLGEELRRQREEAQGRALDRDAAASAEERLQELDRQLACAREELGGRAQRLERELERAEAEKQELARRLQELEPAPRDGGSPRAECSGTPEPLAESSQEASGAREVPGEGAAQDGAPRSPAALVPASAEWDVQACRREIESLTEERDQLRARLQEELSQRAAPDEPEQPSGESGEDGQEAVVETQPRAGGDEPVLPQAEDPQGLAERLREALAKLQEAEEQLAAARGDLCAREGTVEELRAALGGQEAQASRLQQELDTARADLERRMQEPEEDREPRGGGAGEPGGPAEARDAALQSAGQEPREDSRAEGDAGRQERAALAAERDQLAASLRAAEAELCREREAALEDARLVRRQLEAREVALAGAEAEKAALAQQLQDRLEEAARERDGLSASLQEAAARAQERQEELDAARGCLQEQQDAVQTLRGCLQEQQDTVQTLQGRLQEQQDAVQTLRGCLQEQQDAVQTLRGRLTEGEEALADAQGQLETTRAELHTQGLELQEKEQRLGESQARAEQLEAQLRGAREEVGRERAQRDAECQRLEEQLRAAGAQARERQEELDAVRGRLQEQQDTVQTLRGRLAEGEEALAGARAQLETARAELQGKTQELHQLWEDLGRAEAQRAEARRLRERLDAQGLALDRLEQENLTLAQQLHGSQQEARALAAERDALQDGLQAATARHLEAQQELEAAHTRLQEQRETVRQLRESISERSTRAPCAPEHLTRPEEELQRKDPPDHGEGTARGDAEQPLTESLREKCSRIRELLKKYAEMSGHYECLDGLAEDLERDIGTQKELSARVKAQLPLPHAQAKQVDKELTGSLRGSMELLRVMKKLKYVLSHVAKTKEEQHEAVSRLEAAAAEEAERQDELLRRIRHLQPDYKAPGGPWGPQLARSMDLHLEELVLDLSASDFQAVRAELEGLVQNRKDTLRLLQGWPGARPDPEALRAGLQEASLRLRAGNNLYNRRTLTILNESTEFEERKAALAGQWERDLRAMRERTEALARDHQALLRAQPPAQPEGQPEGQPPPPATAAPPGSEVRELESRLREAGQCVRQKDSHAARLQAELEAARGSVATLQGQVSQLQGALEKAQGTVQALQDRVALGAQPYKEEIEELKTKLVRRDLEMLTDNKELKKELTSSRAAVEHQKELIRVLRESLRRAQQAHDTSMAPEPAEAPRPSPPLTCGGGSGIVQSTKALILKGEYARLEKENWQLKRQNEQLAKQRSELASSNQQLCCEVRAWKERSLRPRPQPPADPPAPSPSPTRARERHAGPGSPGFPDGRCRSLPARYFDNSGLGLPGPPDTQDADGGAQPAWLAETSVDVPECKTQ